MSLSPGGSPCSPVLGAGAADVRETRFPTPGAPGRGHRLLGTLPTDELPSPTQTKPPAAEPVTRAPRASWTLAEPLLCAVLVFLPRLPELGVAWSADCPGLTRGHWFYDPAGRSSVLFSLNHLKLLLDGGSFKKLNKHHCNPAEAPGDPRAWRFPWVLQGPGGPARGGPEPGSRGVPAFWLHEA